MDENMIFEGFNLDKLDALSYKSDSSDFVLLDEEVDSIVYGQDVLEKHESADETDDGFIKISDMEDSSYLKLKTFNGDNIDNSLKILQIITNPTTPITEDSNGWDLDNDHQILSASMYESETCMIKNALDRLVEQKSSGSLFPLINPYLAKFLQSYRIGQSCDSTLDIFGTKPCVDDATSKNFTDSNQMLESTCDNQDLSDTCTEQHLFSSSLFVILIISFVITSSLLLFEDTNHVSVTDHRMLLLAPNARYVKYQNYSSGLYSSPFLRNRAEIINRLRIIKSPLLVANDLSVSSDKNVFYNKTRFLQKICQTLKYRSKYILYHRIIRHKKQKSIRMNHRLLLGANISNKPITFLPPIKKYNNYNSTQLVNNDTLQKNAHPIILPRKFNFKVIPALPYANNVIYKGQNFENYQRTSMLTLNSLGEIDIVSKPMTQLRAYPSSSIMVSAPKSLSNYYCWLSRNHRKPNILQYPVTMTENISSNQICKRDMNSMLMKYNRTFRLQRLIRKMLYEQRKNYKHNLSSLIPAQTNAIARKNKSNLACLTTLSLYGPKQLVCKNLSLECRKKAVIKKYEMAPNELNEAWWTKLSIPMYTSLAENNDNQFKLPLKSLLDSHEKIVIELKNLSDLIKMHDFKTNQHAKNLQYINLKLLKLSLMQKRVTNLIAVLKNFINVYNEDVIINHIDTKKHDKKVNRNEKFNYKIQRKLYKIQKKIKKVTHKYYKLLKKVNTIAPYQLSTEKMLLDRFQKNASKKKHGNNLKPVGPIKPILNDRDKKNEIKRCKAPIITDDPLSINAKNSNVQLFPVIEVTSILSGRERIDVSVNTESNTDILKHKQKFILYNNEYINMLRPHKEIFSKPGSKNLGRKNDNISLQTPPHYSSKHEKLSTPYRMAKNLSAPVISQDERYIMYMRHAKPIAIDYVYDIFDSDNKSKQNRKKAWSALDASKKRKKMRESKYH